MTINPIEPWNPILGDDNPYFTMYYRDVPNGFRIENLSVDATKYPILNANWQRLTGIANKYYRNCEINGETLQDFYQNLELSLDMGKDKLEKILSNLDLIIFERGSITTRILSEDSKTSENGIRTGTNTDTENMDISKARTGANADNETKNISKGKTGNNSDNETKNLAKGRNATNSDNETKNLAKGRTGSNADNETVNITDKNVELAFNSSNDDPTAKVVKFGTDNVAHTISETETETGTDNIAHTISETETETGTDNIAHTISETETETGTDNINHVIDETETETQNNQNQHTINESDSKNATSEKGLDETISINRYQGENGIDYFEKLITVYPNIPKMFIDMFTDDFILKEVIIW